MKGLTRNSTYCFAYALKLIVLFALFIQGVPANAQDLPLETLSSKETVDISTMSEAELDSYMATLTDKESRELLLDMMKSKEMADESAQSKEAFSSLVIMALQNSTEEVESSFYNIVRRSHSYKESLLRTGAILFNVNGFEGIPKVLGTLVMLLLLGVLLVTLVFAALRGFRQRLRLTGDFTVSTSLSRIAVGLLHDALKIVLFMGITTALTFVFFEQQDPVRVLASTVVILFSSVWMVHVLLRELLYTPVARNLFFTNATDRKIYYWFSMGFFIPSFVSLYSSGLLILLSFPIELVRLNALVLGTIAIWSLIIGVAFYSGLYTKRQVFIPQNKQSKGGQINRYRALVPVFLLMWLIVIHNILTIAEFPGGRFNYFAILLLMLFPLYDRLIQLMMSPKTRVSEIGKQMASAKEASQYNGASLGGSHFVRVLFAVPYAVLIVLCILEGMGFSTLTRLSEDTGTAFWHSILQVLLAIVLGMICWNVVESYVRRNLPEISVDPEVLIDGEGGGSSAATRTQTLLPIFRNFFLFLIVLIVALIVLSALGVNTAPLLAGAGIVGIALGFGAQKLVQDIVSGMFFLIEDAFRIGEYIESDTLVGTVESTSIRSLKLRHHLGPILTVPYSEIRTVKNHSRDFVIMKLKFRVPFDTDIEVVRKTIKKVGQELLQHEELGPDFIAPLKSQGVIHVEDDALMMRMKFTSKPGKQWVIRREAYRLVKEALEQKGIHFAQRQVMVRISDKEEITEEQRKGVVGAASEMTENIKPSDQVQDPLADR